MFQKFLDAYIAVCNEIITESANSVMMFEAGEKAASILKVNSLEDIKKEFEKDGVNLSWESSGEKLLFYVKDLPINGDKCDYGELFRGFFGEIARKLIDPKYYCREPVKFSKDGNRCSFIVEMVK